MTVSSTNGVAVYLGNGAATAFTFNFEFPAVPTPAIGSQYLYVTYTDPSGNVTAVTYGPGSNNYQLVLNAPVPPDPTGVGGIVTYAPNGIAIPTGSKLTVQRALPPVQSLSLENQGSLWQAAIEGELDYLTMLMQSLRTFVTNGGVISFNGRSGVVTLTPADVSQVGGALLASPAFTGVPTAPTATLGDNSTTIATTAFVQEEIATGVPAGFGGVLKYVSQTQLSFLPYKGNLIRVNGAVFPIPVAGIAGLGTTGVFINGVGGQNLVASTLYYVYVFNNAGVLYADYSQTTHVTSLSAGNVGTEIKQGDDTRSLIGMVLVDSAGHFHDDSIYRYVRSWFNQHPVQLSNGFNGGVSSPGTTVVSLSPIAFAGETLLVNCSGPVQNTVNSNNGVNLYINGALINFNNATVLADGTNAYIPMSVTGNYQVINDGLQQVLIQVFPSAGTTGCNFELIGTV